MFLGGQAINQGSPTTPSFARVDHKTQGNILPTILRKFNQQGHQYHIPLINIVSISEMH